MIRRFAGVFGVTIILCASTAPQPAEAQGLMRRLKDKAQEAVGAAVSEPAGNAAPSAPASARTTGTASTSVVQITPDVVARFEAGLRAEATDRVEVGRLLSPETAAKHQQCSQAALSGPEAADLLEEFAPRFEDANPQQALVDYGAALEALVSRSCGPKPEDAEALRRRPARVGSEASGFDAREFAMLKERTLPFCSTESAGRQIPGEGKNIFFVYSDAEVEALRAGCPRLRPLLTGEA